MSKRTKGKITELIRPEHLGQSTQLLVINAIYFAAKWHVRFNPSLSSIETFRSERGNIPVRMMHLVQEKLRYAEVGEMGCRLLEIPYAGHEYTMLVALPVEGVRLRDVEAHVEQLLSKATRNKLGNARVNLTLPAFDIEHESSYIETLRRLGLNLPFSERADFSGIGQDSDRLTISHVLQKATISVNEEGTIATAATSGK